MQKTENPGFVVRGSVLVLKVYVVCRTFLYRAGLVVKLWTMRWFCTLASERGMHLKRRSDIWGLRVDLLTIAIEEVQR